VIKFGRIIAVETSFDDAAIAVIDNDGRILAGYTAGQVELHSPWGGVVPEIAARSHLVDLPQLFTKLKDETGFDDVSFVAVTRGPGLIGSLLIGVNFARGAAFGLSVPCFGFNHLEGHIFSPFIELHDGQTATGLTDRFPAIKTGRPLEAIPFPHLALVVSGGNTLLVRVDGLGEYSVCGETLDDAGGELLDKIAVALGRTYPGGATIEKLAATCDPTGTAARAWLAENRLPIPMRESGDLNFSYSGLKTAALRVIEKEKLHAEHPLEPLFAYELQRALVESLYIKVRDFLNLNQDVLVFTLSGGVAANTPLTDTLRERLSGMGVELIAPVRSLAVDNAEMMAYLAWLYREKFDEMPVEITTFDAEAGLRL
jgi:N6-L-threonylcarbamoyladenine synthase